MRCEDEIDPRWVGAHIPSEHWHFHSQLWKRYGIVLAPGEFSAMVGALRGGTALKIKDRRDGTAIYSFRIRSAGERIYVVAKRQMILTAWPPEKRLNEIRRSLLAQGKADD